MSNYPIHRWINSLKELREVSRDYEVAHCLEDELYLAFVEEIANGTLKGEKAKEVATLLLGTKDIEFPRHTA